METKDGKKAGSQKQDEEIKTARKRKRERERKHGWKVLYVVQIFVGAEKQSGIRDRRDTGRRQAGTRDEEGEELETGYRNRKRVKKGRQKV